ncbi:MAG TPA: PAS domain S-box protein [Anaerolineales bacterium]
MATNLHEDPVHLLMEKLSEYELLRKAVVHSPVILFMLDMDGVIQLSIGKSLAQHRGFDGSLGKSIYEVYGDVPQAIQNFERARRGESFSDLIEASGLALEAHYEPYVDEEDQVKGVVGIALDVTSRLQSERALRASEERYRLLVESVKEYAIFTLDLDGYVTSWNLGAMNIKGYSADEIIGQHFSIFYPQVDISGGKPDIALKHARSRGQFEDEGWRVRKDGSKFWASVVIRALFDNSGELYGFSKVTRDMTQRKEAEEKLRQSEARFRSIFYGVDVGIELVDMEGRILEFNPGLCEMFGYTYAELRELAGKQGNNHANIVANLPVFGELQRGERDYYHAERPFLHRDNHLIWGRLSISLVRDVDDAPQFIIAMIENISQRKQMENELAELNRRLMEGREAERLHLAQELHDGPVQDLYSLSYTLAAFKTGLPPDADLELVEKMGSSVQKVVKTLKGMSGELRPPALAPYGLEKAIRSYIEEFQTSNSDFKVNLDLKSDGQFLPEQVRLVLYRIFQSSFTNIVRHADANNVDLRFIFDDGVALLEIKDDGKGFNIPDRWIELAREGHLGIVGAIERVEAIGGTLNVSSAPGKGTQILAKIPLIEEGPGRPN